MTREKIIAGNPIADFVRSGGHELRRAGQNFVTDGCPVTQHKRGHRPVMIYPETQSWSCHDCKRGGSVIDWVMIERNVTAADAMRILGGGITFRRSLSQRTITPMKAGTCFIRRAAINQRISVSDDLMVKAAGYGIWMALAECFTACRKS
jgi:hypothetical protein